MKTKKPSKFVDYLIIVTSIIIISALLISGYFGLVGLIELVQNAINLRGALIYTGLIFGMSGGIMFFLEMWIRALAKSCKNLRNN